MAYRSNDFEDDFYVPSREREREREFRPRAITRSPPRTDRTPAFLREDARRSEAGQLVLRQRDVETWDRHRSPSPPHVRVREERLVRRNSSPPPFREREQSTTRIYERERERERERMRSPVRIVERPPRSPSPQEMDRIRIVQRERERGRTPQRSPSPPPPPPVVRGPTIEREVITHYRDVDHGMVKARPPSPPPQPRIRERETDIDISLGRNRTEVDITRTSGRSRERRSHFHDDMEYTTRPRRRHSMEDVVDEEARQITSKIDSRGRIGEAYNGATQKWEIVDVPPGTERIRMDGVGGASTETHWERYSGVRRTKFIPERDGALVPAPKEPSRDREREWEREREREREIERERLSVTVTNRNREVSIDRRRSVGPPPAPPQKDMWTEITKDLVCREAIERKRYPFEETRMCFYVMDYLRYDDVLQLIEITKSIRRGQDYYYDDRRHRHHHHHHHSGHNDYRRSWATWDDDRIREREREREIVYDSGWR